ncbi:MAG: hypothetical protein JSS66_06240 [Armatimonadetes bacterium]|nr:hypothetical protein [Armatimonadota bacterium]
MWWLIGLVLYVSLAIGLVAAQDSSNEIDWASWSTPKQLWYLVCWPKHMWVEIQKWRRILED